MSSTYFAVSARSAIGLQRSGNEDSALLGPSLLAVADGMGGHAGGEVASSLAIKTLQSLVPVITDESLDQDSAEDLFLNSVHSIDSEIALAASDQPELRGMGTTLTAISLIGEKVALLHIGDSRCYRLRGSDFEQLSRDHTVVQDLIESKAISQSEIATHPQRSMLTQVLMGEGTTSPILMIFDVKPKDRFLLCSDGLSNVLTEKEIKSIVKKSDRNDAAKGLIDATYINGAPDNVTVVIADIVQSKVGEVEVIGAAK